MNFCCCPGISAETDDEGTDCLPGERKKGAAGEDVDESRTKVLTELNALKKYILDRFITFQGCLKFELCLEMDEIFLILHLGSGSVFILPFL